MILAKTIEYNGLALSNQEQEQAFASKGYKILINMPTKQQVVTNSIEHPQSSEGAVASEVIKREIIISITGYIICKSTGSQSSKDNLSLAINELKSAFYIKKNEPDRGFRELKFLDIDGQQKTLTAQVIDEPNPVPTSDYEIITDDDFVSFKFQVQLLVEDPYKKTTSKNTVYINENRLTGFSIPFKTPVQLISDYKGIKIVNNGQEADTIITITASGTSLNPTILDYTDVWANASLYPRWLKVMTELSSGDILEIHSNSNKVYLNGSELTGQPLIGSITIKLRNGDNYLVLTDEDDGDEDSITAKLEWYTTENL